MLTCQDVANYFIWVAHQSGDYISNLKLQKLVYYSQGLYLALYAEPLFSEQIKAWDHGPVVPPLYHKYKGYGSGKIPLEAEPNWASYSDANIDLFSQIYDTLGKLSAEQLRNKTHEEQPWLSTPQNNVITLSCMKQFFESNLEDFGVLHPENLQVSEKHSDQRSAFDFYLESEDEWAEVYKKLALS